MNWWLSCMKKYADFSGRASRTEYLMFVVFKFIFAIAAQVLDGILGTTNEELGIGLFYGLFSLAILLPSARNPDELQHIALKGGRKK